MKHIEYEVVTFDGINVNERDMKRRLNDLGSQGWQVATMSTYAAQDPDQSRYSQVVTTVVLMRLKQP